MNSMWTRCRLSHISPELLSFEQNRKCGCIVVCFNDFPSERLKLRLQRPNANEAHLSLSLPFSLLPLLVLSKFNMKPLARKYTWYDMRWSEFSDWQYHYLQSWYVIISFVDILLLRLLGRIGNPPHKHQPTPTAVTEHTHTHPAQTQPENEHENERNDAVAAIRKCRKIICVKCEQKWRCIYPGIWTY